jgi:hypothetical protein
MYRNHTAPDVFDRIGERFGSLTENMDIGIGVRHRSAPLLSWEQIAASQVRAHPPNGQVVGVRDS